VRRGRPAYPDVLTPREWEVLALIREGLTNPQIAQRLSISESGARFHVSEILSKLGVESRQEAATWTSAKEHPRRRWLLAFLTAPLHKPTTATLLKAATGAVVIATVVGLIAFAAAVLSSNHSPRVGLPEVLPTSTPPSVEVTSQFPALLASSRDRLRICVASVDLPDFNLATAVNGLTAALPELASHPRWEEFRYGDGGGPLVGVGCPGEPFALQPGVRVIHLTGPAGSIFPPRVQQASPYRLHMFIASQQRLASAFDPTLAYRMVTEEILVLGNQGVGVTNGIYLTPAEMKDQDLLIDWLKKGLNLDPPFERTPDNCQQQWLAAGMPPRDTLNCR
jgi:DNA-binding CsgD family transcriptional regulator